VAIEDGAAVGLQSGLAVEANIGVAGQRQLVGIVGSADPEVAALAGADVQPDRAGLAGPVAGRGVQVDDPG
jgi:hypothetical protein